MDEFIAVYSSRFVFVFREKNGRNKRLERGRRAERALIVVTRGFIFNALYLHLADAHCTGMFDEY